MVVVFAITRDGFDERMKTSAGLPALGVFSYTASHPAVVEEGANLFYRPPCPAGHIVGVPVEIGGEVANVEVSRREGLAGAGCPEECKFPAFLQLAREFFPKVRRKFQFNIHGVRFAKR